MTTLNEIKQRLHQQKNTLTVRYKVKQIGLFGSYVRGEQAAQSDLDILIDFDEYPSLLEFIGLEDELSQLLDVNVDLVMKSDLKPHIGAQILREVIYV